MDAIGRRDSLHQRMSASPASHPAIFSTGHILQDIFSLGHFFPLANLTEIPGPLTSHLAIL
jgi:hypothetical protein